MISLTMAKEIEYTIFIENISKYYRSKILSILNEFQSEAIGIATKYSKDADIIASKKLIDGYDTIIENSGIFDVFKLVNSARSDKYDEDTFWNNPHNAAAIKDGWDVYYWNVISEGRRPNLKMPPLSNMFQYQKNKAGFRSPRSSVGSKRGRFIKQNLKGQAFALAKTIAVKGITPRPYIFQNIRKEIYNRLYNILNG